MDGIKDVNFYHRPQHAPCYYNRLENGTHALDIKIINNDNDMTIEKCMTGCQERGYSFFGIEYSKIVKLHVQINIQHKIWIWCYPKIKILIIDQFLTEL